MALNTKEIEYKNFGKCISIDNGIIEAIITIDVGPRIISFRFCDGENVLYTDERRTYAYDDESIRNYYGETSVCYNYGGHRFTTIPEDMPYSFYPDNEPVVYSLLTNGVEFAPPIQRCNDIALSIEVLMNPDASDIMVVHSLKNHSENTKLLGLSGATDMAPGGLLIVPQNTNSTNEYLPNRSFALWSYSRLDDDRVFMGNKYITVKQDENIRDKFKIGTNNHSNWASYLNKGVSFTKNYVHNKKAKYPDYNSSFEVMADGNMLEIKSLSPLYEIEPEEITRHVENWSLKRCEMITTLENDTQIDSLLTSL